MFHTYARGFGLAVFLAAPAAAQTMASMQSATELGTVIGSEQACGLTLDQAGIEAWIAANVAEDDMSFASTLNMMVQGTAFQIEEMTQSAKTAHCAAVKRSAGKMGLIR